MTPSVSVLMGSTSDETVMKMAVETLRGLAVECEMRVLSAHRTPEALRDYVIEAGQRGVKVFICGAGGAAHLAGAVAAITTSPVIGVPLVSPNAIAGGLDALLSIVQMPRGVPLVSPNAIAGGLDALLSIVQMPRGVPVATVAVGEAGAANAGILAAQILATGDEELAGRIRMMREGMAAKVLAG